MNAVARWSWAVLWLGSASGVAEERPARPEPPALDEVMPNFRRFGIDDPHQLRTALLARWPRGGPEISRSHGWMLGWLWDAPGALPVWAALLQEDPDDLEAVHESASVRMRLGQLEEAEAILKGAEGRALVLRDQRAVNYVPADIEALWCLLHRKTYAPEKALPHCRRAAEAGLDTGRTGLARVHLMRAEPDLALGQLAAVQEERIGKLLAMQVEFLRGVAHQQLGREDEARAAWERSLERMPAFFAADRAVVGTNGTVMEHLKAEEQWFRQRDATNLAHCGHYYLDLELPERAEPCFAAADAIERGHAMQERIAHLAETDPAQALLLAEQALAAERNPFVLTAAGWLQHRVGHSELGRQYLEEVLERDPRNDQANINLATLCLDVGDTACADEHFARTGRSSNDVRDAVLKFVALLVPLGLVYVAVRRWILSRSRRAAA